MSSEHHRAPYRHVWTKGSWVNSIAARRHLPRVPRVKLRDRTSYPATHVIGSPGPGKRGVPPPHRSLNNSVKSTALSLLFCLFFTCCLSDTNTYAANTTPRRGSDSRVALIWPDAATELSCAPNLFPLSTVRHTPPEPFPFPRHLLSLLPSQRIFHRAKLVSYQNANNATPYILTPSITRDFIQYSLAEKEG